MSTLAPHLDLSVVVPAYNETARIAPTLQKLHAFLETQDSRYEIIVVDDGSSDGTAEHVERLAIPHVRVIRSRPNRGKGAAVRTGMLDARGLVRVMCDADGSMPPEEMPKLLAELRCGAADIAIGSRYASGAAAQTSQPLYRRLWSRLCNRVIQKSLVPGIRDTQCGFKAFTAIAAEDLFSRARIDGWAFDLEILALAKRRHYAVAEVGVSWTDDKRSRVSPIRDLVKVVRETITIRRNLKGGVYGALAA
ncbi:MAG TPA: dolichyl-phosphate beta-glucosyltransferase [Kofleriaceae bacterium]|nr:dolichyl-phosphate beta-glucosyltransferase [Kofleriaceae bacterium]